MASSTMITGPDGAKGLAAWRWRAESLPRWWPYAVIVLGCFLIRLPTFGHPMLEFDEQLYLLVGDRMVQGQLPYVDLWDRKPIGLFLSYAGIRLLGGSGIVQYQIVATACVAITGCFIWTIARRAAGVIPSFGAALAYVLFLNVLSGTGGQASCIYNVFTACAAWAAFRSNDTHSPVRIVGLAMLSMAMIGIAIQFKYTPAVEGAFLGCWFLWRLWQVRMPLWQITGVAAAMIALALLPTAAAIGYYAAIGHLDAFVQANFISVFHRHPFPAETRWKQLKFVVIKPICLIVVTPYALVVRYLQRNARNTQDFALLAGWTLFAVIAFLMLGDFYDFYFITVVLPLCIVVAPLIDMSRIGFSISCMLALWPLLLTPHYYFTTRFHQHAARDLTNAVAPYVAHHCLYIYDGPAVIYLLTNACAPSRYIYPDHLNNPTEAPALGVDPVAEMTRVLASRPGAILTADRPVIPRVNPATQVLVRDALARDYVLVARVPANDRVIYAWARKDLHPAPSVINDPRSAMPE
ncbi:hypothetical protein [Novosphingobium sp.]|uniref:hypothetical protein n=1 Tax=Novosphingobium sp. TaxID=1874826 RepID=UPI0033417036